jgi:predicted DNA-binding transcriptional regulator AlpA
MSEIPNKAIALLTDTEVAEILRLSPACLRRWRLTGTGPRFVKVGNLVRYRAEDLNLWIRSRPAGGDPVTAVTNE